VPFGEILIAVLSAPIASTTALTTSITNFQRFSTLPPYSSVRIFEFGAKN